MPYADPEQARAAARARYQRNRSKVIAQAAAWAAAHPERKREIAREWARKHGRESYRRNRAVALACAARWKRANPEKVREIKAAWQRRNPEQRRMNEAARRARKAGLVTEKIDALVVFARDAGLCGLCGDPVDPSRFHIDHVRPLACGGTHTYGNVQLAHPACNLRKGARLV
jgi:5-methylcytosine-specific restriction endonuclease McrA